MKKWNMIIDVAECTNCQLCTLATMDEYVGNDWPGYTKPMPKHGHKWINILQKERGQVPMIDIAYVPTLCNHCDDAPCMEKAGDAIKSTPAVESNRVYFGCDDQKVYAVDVNTHNLIWSFPTGGWVRASVAPSGQTVYAASVDQKLYALDAATGIKKWEFAAGSGDPCRA